MSASNQAAELEGEAKVHTESSQLPDGDPGPNAGPETEASGPRRGERERHLTPKAQQLAEEEALHQTKKVQSTYEIWRMCAVETRKKLRIAVTLEHLQELQDNLKNNLDRVVGHYEQLKKCGIPERDIVTKVDNCCSISEQLMETLTRRRLETPQDFDAIKEKEGAREMKYAHPSVFGESLETITGKSGHHSIGSQSVGSNISSLKVKADIERAEEVARAKALEEEQLQKTKILQLQLQMEEEKMKLEAIQANAAIKIAEAKCDVIAEAVDPQEKEDLTNLNLTSPALKVTHSLNHQNRPPSTHPSYDANPTTLQNAPHTANLYPTTDSSLAQALANAMDRNRLPVPTPKVFSGNPLEFVNFKTSFKALIENKGISAEERIYYLRQYVSGEAKESIAGCFYGTQEADYKRAWETLEKRYGHPFKIAEAYREKLDKWPKVNQRDAVALQRYADFLQSCLDAMPYIKSLSVLNDCKENQKMLTKLPDWAVNRWSRIVTESLDGASDYPNFSRFVSFVQKEVRVARHPVASLSAIKGSDFQTDIKPRKPEKTRSAGALATNVKDSPSASSAPEKSKICPFCKGGHYLSSCSEFAGKGMEERTNFMKEQKRCFSCLRTGHFSRQCKSRHTCQKCKGRHPTVLHDDQREKPTTPTAAQTTQEVNSAVSLKTNIGQLSTTNVLPVWVSSVDRPKAEKLVYALLDTQSDSTFIDKGICEDLGVNTDTVKLKLTTMLGKDASVMSQRATGLRVRGYSSNKLIDLPVTYTRDFIPLERDHIPTCETARSWNHLTSISHEIPPLLDCEVGLLIGYNCSSALTPRQVISGEDGQPFAVKTDLGWSVVGRLASADSTDVTGFCHRVSLKEAPPVSPRDVLNLLERDFMDTKQGDVSVSQEDVQFLKIMEGSVVVNAKGHLEMPLPFKVRPKLPDNRRLAAVRLFHLKKRLDHDPKYKEQYVNFMEEMLKDGEAELAVGGSEPGEVSYIPHHGVFHPRKPDKLRVVFDCSAKYQGTSLNDHLLSGPDLTNSLFGVLCRFRREPIAIMCDVQKMFHRFHVSPKDRDYLRFLWYEGGDTSKLPQEYRMNVHLFGAKSSPGCANFGLKKLSEMYEDNYPLAASFLKQDFYVDDGVTSVRNKEEAKALIQEARELCLRGNLRLHKFISNNREVVESVPITERATGIQDVDLSKEDLPVEKTLGICWNVESDAFTFQVNVKDRPNTRRGILSVVASMFDPLGFIAPFILEGKAILQEMCKRGVDWDDEVCDHLRPRWDQWKGDLRNLKAIHLPRCYKPPGFGPVSRVELHHFSDASTTGYGMCSYLRFISGDRIHCTLVVAKARVSPTKVVTIPRLELTAAAVAVKMSIKLKQELQMHIDSEHFWCDSQVVLAYINNDARKFHVFVSNRVQLIKENTDVAHWHYVPTKENPADHTSRGLSTAELISSNWFAGPEFLWRNDPIESCHVEPKLMVGDPEVKAQALNVQSTPTADMLETLSKYSSWTRLSRIVARIRRLARKTPQEKMLTLDEINEAGLAVIRLVQADAFHEEIQVLKMKGELPSRSKLFGLSPFIQDGLIRVGGRLRRSSMSLEEKHPIILPKRSYITQLIIAHCHSKVKHQGRGQTLHKVRQEGYWVLGGSKLLANFIRNCVICRKLRRPVQEQKMSDLPEDRVEPSPPFTNCGMDCFGPFITKQGRKEFKRYGLLFTCLCSRAVHIELVEDMTTDAFINALRCFIAVRGTVSKIRSDQGSNFIGADNELKMAMKQLDADRISTYLAKNQCSFVFNVPYSSHTGGVWERQIRSVRNVLNATITLCPKRLDDASLRCYFYEAMSIINSRPLVPVSMTDPLAEAPLTPNHLITMKSTSPLPPPGSFVKEDMYAKKRWRRVQFLSEQFWSRWKKEYLQNLQKREKWNVPRRNLRVGDVVLVKNHTTPRMEWPLGLVITANADDDGLVRKVAVRMGSGSLEGRQTKRLELERPIQQVVLLVEQVTSSPSASENSQLG